MAPADVSNHSSNVEQSHTPVQSISKAMDIPVFKSAVFYASDFYQRVKAVNPLLESGLSRAEQTVLLVADSAKPVLRQFEGPINYADSLVCSGLDKLEEKVPAIKKSPEELKSVGWTTVEALRSYGTGRLDDIRGYVHNQVEKASSNAYAQAVLKTVDTAVHLTDHAIDMYLPAGEEEEKENQSNGHNKVNEDDASQSSEQKLEALAQKVSHLSGKVRRRLSQYDLTSNRVFGLIRHQSAPAVTSN